MYLLLFLSDTKEILFICSSKFFTFSLKAFSEDLFYDIMKKFTNSIYKEIQMGESNFVLKVEAACHKKEELYTASKARYAVRSMFAGAFLTMSTAVGIVGADLLNTFLPGSGRFLFPFFFSWGGCPLFFFPRFSLGFLWKKFKMGGRPAPLYMNPSKIKKHKGQGENKRFAPLYPLVFYFFIKNTCINNH